jgi:DNA-binding MarR family transcriptional regulator
LWQLTHLWQRAIRKALEPYGLTHSQYVLLASIHWLSLHKKAVTQVELSAHTQIDPMTTSAVLRTLQKKGLLQRREHLTDTRAKTVMLTDKGIDLTRVAVKAVECFDAGFFSGLGDQANDFNRKIQQLLDQVILSPFFRPL